MPRQQVKKTYFNFVGGLNTEAGYLTFPPNVWKDGDNIIPQLDGSLKLRTSMNYEDNFVFSAELQTTTQKEALAFGCHEWSNAGGIGGNNLVVTQRGRYIQFYRPSELSLSEGELATPEFQIDLNTYVTPFFIGSIGQDPIAVASGNGKLIIVSASTEPLLVTYSEDGLTVVALDVLFRDFEGAVDDPLLGASVDTEPSALDTDHDYNLHNQGWDDTKIDAYFTAIGRYPSNAQQWIAGKNTTDDFTPSLLVKQDFGKSRAPLGRFLLSAFTRDRTAASGVEGFDPEIEIFRFTTTAFYAGRTWFAGLRNSTKLGSWVFFSQVTTGDDKYGSCYQAGDPTSEQNSDLVASDGGTIIVHGAGEIKRLVPTTSGMLIFADNGVWAVTGTISAGFSADGYEVKQVTTMGAISGATIVPVNDTIMYWAADGVWAIQLENTNYIAKHITLGTIASFYRAIPADSKEYAVGRFHQEEGLVYWLFNSVPSSPLNRFVKDRMLVLDTRIGAWFTHTIKSLAVDTPLMIDLIATRGKDIETVNFSVVTLAAENVIVTNGDTVEYGQAVLSSTGSSTLLKFMTLVPTGTDFTVTWSEFEDVDEYDKKWFDWYDQDTVGVGYVGFILTGYDIGAQQGGDRKLQGNYLTVLMKRTEVGVTAGGLSINDSSVLMSSRWHFTDSSAANKWSTPIEVYRHRRIWIPPVLPSATFDDGFAVVITKPKLRGRGNAFQLKFESTIGKDFQLIGWSVPILSNVD